MEGSYKTFLEMKTLFSEFPSSFYSKLSKSELDKFKQLIQAAESLKPSPAPKRPKRTLAIDPIYFQPKSIIFCLNIKKLFTKKKFAYTRFSFALIRCLFKEYQRIQARKAKFEMKLNKEPFSKDIGIDAERLESELTERVEYGELKTYQALEKIFMNNKNFRIKQRILTGWKRGFEGSKEKKKKFLSKMKKIVKGMMRKLMGSVIRFKNWKILAGNTLVKVLLPVMRARKNKVFLVVFFRARFMTPVLTVKTAETVTECNVAKSGDGIGKIGGVGSKENKEFEDDVQDFKYIERKNTKMIKKKKVLLGKAPKKIEKIEKNHKWVLAFAMLKWKKVYFNVKSEVQNRPTVVSLAADLLSIFSHKYQKRLSSILFENLKVKYLISIQNKNFKTYLLFKMISGIISNRQKILIYRAFRAIYSSHHKKVSFPNLSIDLKNLHEHETRGEILFKVLKKLHTNSILKKKVSTFVSIQNCEPTSQSYMIRYGLKCLYNSLEKLIFFKKHLIFFDVKQKTFILKKKCEFLLYSVQYALDKACLRNLKFSVFAIKLCTLDQIEVLMLDIDKVQRRKIVRSAFEDVKEFAIDMGNFIYARNLFTGSLMNKIYFKRVSSSMLKWQGLCEEMQMAEELGLMTTMIVPKRKIASFDFSEDDISENESLGFNCEIDTVSEVHSSESSPYY